MESDDVMNLASKHQISGWGWQQNNSGLPMEELNLFKQSKGFNEYVTTNNAAYNATQSTFVYRSGYSAGTFWNSSNITMLNDSIYNDFWMKNDKGQTCWTLPGPYYSNLTGGPIWNFSNPNVREYYLNNVVNGYYVKNNMGYVNSIFFDMCDWVFCDFSWSKNTNCSNFTGLSDDEKTQFGNDYIDTMIKATEMLNNINIIPIFSLRTTLEKYMYNYTECVIPEETWIYKLFNYKWIRYQERWPDCNENTKPKTNNSVAFLNMLDEMEYNIPVQIHAYNVYPNHNIDPYYIATFLIAQYDYTYFGASDGWFDNNWSWHNSYDIIYGKPSSIPIKLNDTAYMRKFTNYNIFVDLQSRTAVFESISQ